VSAVAPPRSRTWLLAALAVAATAVLAIVSRGKWSDPLIDSGREWLVPDTLVRGRWLYRDVVYWFGPLTPYLHAAFFRMFGSGFATLVFAGAVAAAAALAGLYAAVGRVADRVAAALWTALAVPALVFMPNAGGAILGMGFRIWHAAALSLFALVLLSGVSLRSRHVIAAGACAALAGLCRVEWGVAALAASALVVVVRRQDGRVAGRLAGLIGAYAVVFGLVWAFFFVRVGWRAVVLEQPVFLLHIPVETPAGSGLAGLLGWRTGIWNLLYAASVVDGAWLGIALLALRSDDPARTRRRLYRLLAALAVAAGCALLGALDGPVLFSAAPAIGIVALVRGLRGGRTPRSSALAGLGAMALLASHRRFFFLGNAPYVAPPLLFAFAAAAGLAWDAARDEVPPEGRRRLTAAYRAALAGLVAVAFAGRIASYAADDRVAILGTAGMLSAPAETAHAIAATASAVNAQTPSGSGLVVFPEGELLNFLAGRANPLRHALYLPGYLTDANEADVLAELAAARPAAIVVWRRPTAEYARGLFGVDYGRRIADWIRDHYDVVPFEQGAARANPTFTLYRLRERSS
jgi:hypothetical protein